MGLVAGIGAATAVSLLAYRHERRHHRAGNLARIALGFVLVQAALGLISKNEIVYLAQPVLVSAAWGIAFLASTTVGRPLAGLFAEDIYPVPAEVKASLTFRVVMARVSTAWGICQLLRSSFRLLILTRFGVEYFIVVNFVTGVPLIAAMMSWSIWYAVRSFRRSDEWGWALRGDPPPPEIAARFPPTITPVSSAEAPRPGKGPTAC